MNLLKIFVKNPSNTLSHLFRVSCFTLLISLGLLISYFTIPALAQQPFDAKVDFFAVPPENGGPFTVGDQITLRLEVRHPVDSRVTLPNIPEEWESFDVINQTETTTVNNNDGTATTGKDIIVSLFKPGSYQTPRVVVTHFRADGSSEDLGAPVIPIWPWIVGGFILALVLGGILIGAGLWVYHRRKQQVSLPVPLMPAVDNRPPEVIAYSELDRIEALNLPAKDQFKEHYTLVTDCLRRYIEGRYQIPALEQTTGEIRTAFTVSPTPVECVRDFMNIFMESDFVKFARLRPGAHQAYELIPKARTIVNATTPVPEPLEESLEAEPEVVA